MCEWDLGFRNEKGEETDEADDPDPDLTAGLGGAGRTDENMFIEGRGVPVWPPAADPTDECDVLEDADEDRDKMDWEAGRLDGSEEPKKEGGLAGGAER